MTEARASTTLHWPDEDNGSRDSFQAEINRFLHNYRTLPDRIEAGRSLAASTVRKRDTEAKIAALEADHPHHAARIRSEDTETWLHTVDGLRAEAALADAAELRPVEAVTRLGAVSDSPVGERLIADALADAGLRAMVVEGLRLAFDTDPVFDGDGESGDSSRTVEEVRHAIRHARATWADQSKRNLHEARMSLQCASHFLIVPSAHCLMASLYRAAPEAAITLLDAMPSPLDVALCLEIAHLDVDRFETWSYAVRRAPSAWDTAGWTGAQKAPRGLALPLLLWRAEEHLSRMPAEAEPDRAAYADVAAALRGRDDGDITAWYWCAELLREADRRDRNGRAGPEDGLWRMAQALAAEGDWSGFDPGRARDALFLEAARRLVPEAQDAPPHLAALLPPDPEAFLNETAGADLSWMAFGLVGALGPMFEGRPPYGLVTRILSAAFWGMDGPERLSALWRNSLVLRELAAGGVTNDRNQNAADRRDPTDTLHLIVAMGIAAVERSKRVDVADTKGLLTVVDGMLAELRPWDTLGYSALTAHRQQVAS